MVDQRGTTHRYDYDLLGRLQHDRVTVLGTDVDGTVRRLSRSYEVRGLLEKTTSHSSATVGGGSVVNEVQLVYNDFAQPLWEYQSHTGAVNTSNTLKVGYSYENGSANTVRPTQLQYSSGKQLGYSYGTTGGMDDVLSRVQALTESVTGSLASYT